MAQHNGDDRYMTAQTGEVLPPDRRGSAVRSDFAWVDSSWGARSRNEKLGRTIEALTGGLEKCREYNEAADRYERSRQQLALTRSQATLLPLQLERQSAAIYRQIVDAQTDVDRAIQQREIAHLEVRIRIRKLEAELAQLINPAPASAPRGDTPEAFRRHFKNMQEAKANLSEGERRIQAIYARAAAERRQLSDDELMEVDASADAASAASAEVRRAAASDF